jgi:uncharacterized BrkB/YihY/UPF0761 family membrane protein
MNSGLNEQDAFNLAIQKIGRANALTNEFKKIGGTKEMTQRMVKKSLVLIFLVLTAIVAFVNICFVTDAIIEFIWNLRPDGSQLDEWRTVCLMDGLLLSLVLPFTASLQTTKNAAGSKRRLRIVWTGQLLMGLCGLLVILSSHPIFGLLAAISICIGFTLALRQQTRAAVARS